MSKLLLTIDIDVNDPVLIDLIQIYKINYGQIVDKPNPDFQSPEDLHNLRQTLLLQAINDCKGDLLIGFAINTPEHLEDLLNRISSTNFKITDIFYSNEKRRQENQEEYQEQYKLHSRWLGYSPEEVKKMNDEFYEIVDVLLKKANSIGIQCTPI